jgi:hypothetical protein
MRKSEKTQMPIAASQPTGSNGKIERFIKDPREPEDWKHEI